MSEVVSKSKIDQLGLAEKVLELRQNLSLEKAAEVINTKFLPDGAEPINAMTITRWEKARNAVPETPQSVFASQQLNALAELITLKNRSDKHIQRLNKKIEELRQDEERLSELASISNAYVSAMKAHQSLMGDIAKAQKEMMKVENVKRVVGLMMQILQKYPEVWNAFLIELRKHEEEYELMNML